MDYKRKHIISTVVERGNVHDFTLLKASIKRLAYRVNILVDKGYKGIEKLGCGYLMPFKATKYLKLDRQMKQFNKVVSSKRIVIEHAFGFIKKFKILGSRYRNRRSRIGLRFNLIAAIYNMEMATF